MPILLFFFGPNLFSFFFGERWEIAGEIAKVLSVWIFFDFIRATISQLPIVLNKQKQLLQFSILGNILLFSVIIYFGVHELAILECFKYLTVLMSVYALLIIVWIFRISQKN
jgi:O-antigen/teichoic acid export membrane protein